MSDRLQFRPWQLAALGLALVVVTVLLTRLVVVNWAQREAEPNVVVPPSAAISTQAPACEPSPKGVTHLTGSVNTPERPSSTRPAATLRARAPRSVPPLQPPGRTPAVAREPMGSSSEPAMSAMPDRGAPVDDADRVGRNSGSDGEAPRASKASRRFTFKSFSRHDDPRGRAAPNESP